MVQSLPACKKSGAVFEQRTAAKFVSERDQTICLTFMQKEVMKPAKLDYGNDS
jgi:hypothetical protein